MSAEFSHVEIDNRRFACVLRDDGADATDITKNSAMLRESAALCAWPKLAALRSLSYWPVRFNDARYRFDVANGVTLRATTKIDPNGVAVDGDLALFRAALEALRLGDAIVLYASAPLAQAGKRRRLFFIVAFVPWVFAAEALASARVGALLEWRQLLTNEISPARAAIGAQHAALVPFLTSATPFMPLTDEPLAESAEWPPKAAALLSFCLRWHKVTRARGNYEDIEEYRDKLRKETLELRSCVFFADAPPRRVLFGGADAWPTIVGTIRRLGSSIAAEFVRNQICDVAAYVTRCEIASAGDYAVLSHLEQLLIPLAAQIESADASPPPDLSTLPPALQEAQAAPFRNCVLTRQLRRSRSIWLRPLELRARSLAMIGIDELNADQRCQLSEAFDVAPAPVFNGSSSASASGGVAKMLRRSQIVLEESTGATATSRDSLSKNAIVLSFALGVGCKFVLSALLADGNGRRCVVSRGRVYLRAAQALEASQQLFKALLSGHIGATETATAAEPDYLERQLLESMPAVGDYYHDCERRLHTLDDMAFDTDVYREMLKIMIHSGLHRDDASGRHQLPPPTIYDDAVHYRLAQSDDFLRRHHRVPYTLFSPRHGTVAVPPADLDAVLHTARCGHARGYRMTESDAGERLQQTISHCTDAGGTPVADMEDLVGNAIENRAVPPCVVAHLRRPISGGSGFDYPRYEERYWLARTLHSFQAPSLTTPQIIRSMMRYSTEEKTRVHYKELSRFTVEDMAQTREETIARKRLWQRDSAASVESTTTCALACASLDGVRDTEKNVFCIFAPQNAPDLDRILRQTGVEDAADRARIRDSTSLYATERCMLHLESSRPANTRHVPVLDAGVHGVKIHQPYEYFHLAARHAARAAAAAAAATATTHDDR